MQGLTFGVLGPVEVRSDGRPLPVPGPLRRGLLGLLVLNAGHVLPLGRIVEALWGGLPPSTADAQVRAGVGVVRKALRDGAGDGVLRTSSAGYVLDAPPDGCDDARFRRLLAESRARTAAGHPAEAAELAEGALGLWRGPALAGASGAYVDAARAELDEHRLGAEGELAAALLALGRHADALPRLTGLVADHPLHQDLHAKLMLALYRAGRADEALAAYQRLRRRLAAELAVEPGRALAELHGSILRSDPALDPPRAQRPPRPAQLPAAPGPFVGRGDELARLDAATLGDGDGPPIAVVTGPPGVGKSALALRWAHARRDRFPDGELHVDLRGSGDPVPPERALTRLLRALGVDADRAGPDPDDLQALYRSALDGRRLLLLLDDAPGSAALLPLLPGSASCTVLVTSRTRPDALAVEHAVTVVELGPLPRADSLALIGRVAGADRAAGAEPLAELCGDFPLALRVAAAKLAAAPGLPAADLARQIGGLSGLALPGRGVRAVLEGAYAGLEPPVRALFGALGAHPGSSFGADAAAALAGIPRPDAVARLDRLVAAHLLVAGERGRFRFHDLIRAYAAELPAPPGGTDRLVGLHLAVARAASLLLAPSRAVPAAAGALPAGVAPPRTTEEAHAWLDAERPEQEAVLRLAPPAAAARLAGLLARYHDVRGFWSDFLPLGRLGLAGAEAGGDPVTVAESHGHVGVACTFTGRLDEAAVHLASAAGTYDRLGEPLRLGRTLNNLAIVHRLRGDTDAALGCYRRALRLQVADPAGVGLVLSNIGDSLLAAGDPAAGLPYQLAALSVRSRFGSDRDVAHALANVGDTHLRRGRPDAAVPYLRRAVELARRTGDYRAEAQALTGLGEAYAAAGDLPAARAELHAALERRRRTADPDGEAEVLARLYSLRTTTPSTDPASA